MSWSYVVSSDLARWDRLPGAIPEDQSAAIFIDSSVADPENTSSLYQSVGSCVVSVYTRFTEKTVTSPTRQIQNLAFSQDDCTWAKYSGNPVLDLGRSDSRNPKIFRYASGGSGEQYFIEPFNGTRFRDEGSSNQTRWLDYGRDCCCALTFNNDTKAKAPHIIGWMNNWQYGRSAPTAPWRGAMTLPRLLALSEENGSLALIQNFVENFRSLRADTFEYRGGSEADLNRKLADWPHWSQAFEAETTMLPDNAKQITWTLLDGQSNRTLVGFDANKQELLADRSGSANAPFSDAFPSSPVASLSLGGEPLQLHTIVDHSSVEMFAQDGRVAMTNLVFSQPVRTSMRLSTYDGPLNNIHFNVWKLDSAWKESGK